MLRGGLSGHKYIIPRIDIIRDEIIDSSLSLVLNCPSFGFFAHERLKDLISIDRGWSRSSLVAPMASYTISTNQQ